ncbi:MAG: glycoside hydrolase family 2 TIM barrel-domain containing protein [bacterium]
MRILKFVPFVFWPFLLTLPAWAQSQLQTWYLPAPHVSHGATPANSPRQILSLNGTWQATCDRPKFAGPVKVPGAFLFEGEMSFERSFRLADSLRQRSVRLHVGGLNHHAQLALNNSVPVRHFGGYLSFSVDLRSANLRFGQDNTIAIKVDNRLSPLGSLPPQHRPFGWRNEGGIIREIYLEILPEIHFAEYAFKQQLQQDAVRVEFRAQARAGGDLSLGPVRNLTATLEIWDAARVSKLASSPAQALTTWEAGRSDVALDCLFANPALWSPAAPNLYALRAVLQREKSPRGERETIDELWQETGFRHVAVINKELWLNGKKLALYGMNWIEEYGEQAALLDTASLQSLIASLKQLGANALRVVGHAPHPLLPTWCDRAGIFLLEESPMYCLTQAHYRDPRFAQIAQAQLHEMVQRDRHHPSVLAWGLGVSSRPATESAQKVVTDLAAALRSQDSRLIYAVTPPAWQSLWQKHVDFLLVDWLKRGNLDSLITMQDQNAKLILPVLGHYVSAAAANAQAQLLADEIMRAEDVQAEYFSRVLKTLRDRPRAGGYFLQAFSDWEGPMPYLAAGALKRDVNNLMTVEVQPGDWSELAMVPGTRLHAWGLVTANGRQRAAYSVVQAYNRGEREPSIMTRGLPAGHPGVFQIAGIALILLFLFFLQRDRRLRGNLRRVFVHPHGFYHDLYEHRKIAPFLTVLIGLTESAIVAFLLVQFCYAFRQSLVFDQILNLVLADASWKAVAIWLIWHPGWFMFWGTLAIFLFGAVLGLLFRLTGVLVGTGLSLSQYVTSIYWSWANLLLLGVLTPVFYRLLLNAEAWRPVLILVLAFKVWLLVRVFRAIRVLYMVSYLRAASILLLVFGSALLTFWLYFDRTRAFTEYARYYLSMLRMI